MTLELQPGGKLPLTFQCLDCERPDPLKSKAVGWLKGEPGGNRPRPTLSVFRCPNLKSVHFSTFRWNESLTPASCVLGLVYQGIGIVIGKEYFVRQAATLLRFAKTTTNPDLAAGLAVKAADLKSQVDDETSTRDLSPLAPDIEPPPAT